jgi:hypothetical protein
LRHVVDAGTPGRRLTYSACSAVVNQRALPGAAPGELRVAYRLFRSIGSAILARTEVKKPLPVSQPGSPGSRFEPAA